jgi:hypothetical protein
MPDLIHPDRDESLGRIKIATSEFGIPLGMPLSVKRMHP